MYFSCLMDGENVRTDTGVCFGKEERICWKDSYIYQRTAMRGHSKGSPLNDWTRARESSQS